MQLSVSLSNRKVFGSMELLPEVDSVLREFMPGVLATAGLPEQARALRGLHPVVELDSVEDACELLRAIGHEAHQANPAEWAEIVEEVAFWGEAAVLSAASNSYDLFMYCIRQIQKAVHDGDRLLLIH